MISRLNRLKYSFPPVTKGAFRKMSSASGVWNSLLVLFCVSWLILRVSCIERECVDQKLIMNRLHTWILISKNWPLLIMPIFVVCGITPRLHSTRDGAVCCCCCRVFCYCWWVNADNRIWKAGVLWERGRIWNKAHAGVWSFGVFCNRHSGLLFG